MFGLLKYPRLRTTRSHSITSSLPFSRAISNTFQSRPSTHHLPRKIPHLHRNAHAALAMSPKPNGAPNGHVLESYGNFDLVRRLKLDFAADITVSKWKSRETGLSVVHLDYEGAHIPWSRYVCQSPRLTVA